MKYLLFLCVTLSAQHTVKLEISNNNQKSTSTVYVENEYVISVSNRISQVFNSKTNELYKVDFSKKRLVKQSFKKAERLKSIISPFISKNTVSEKKLENTVLGYSASERKLTNQSSAAKINATFIVTTDAKNLTQSLAAYMRRIRDLTPFEFPIKENELVLDLKFKWKLSSMAELFLTGKNKRFINMETQMKILSISDGITNKQLLKEVLGYSRS